MPMRMDISLFYDRFSGLEALMKTYVQYGYDIRLVGGCIRNMLLGKPIHDIDLATPCPPHEAAAFLKKEGMKVVLTGISHGTITAVIQGQAFEITTLRRDVETTGRHARVHFTDCWMTDASRRDFTFNALYGDASGQIYDYFGGISDLQQGVVRFIGDPRARIEEDYLRILRLFRFYARYARQPILPEVLALCREYAPHLGTLSKERITQEVEKILMADGAVAALMAMKTSHVLEAILPTYTLETFKEVVAQEPPLPAWLPRRLAALTTRLESLRLRRSTVQDCQKIWKVAQDPSEVWYYLYVFGQDVTLSGLMLARVLSPELRLQLVQQAGTPPFPLNGRDVLACGVPSQQVGALLERVQKWWARAQYQPSREACLRTCQRYWKEGRPE